MKADYDSSRTVRRARLFGGLFCAVLAVGLMWAMSYKILQVSEARAFAATRENLLASLTALVAERVAQGKGGDLSGLTGNPFQLLRWPSSDYCGELAAPQLAQAGCWYYLPARGWLLYRSRFTDAEQGSRAELRVFRLQVVPKAVSGRSESKPLVQTLELQALAPAEVSALADSYP